MGQQNTRRHSTVPKSKILLSSGKHRHDHLHRHAHKGTGGYKAGLGVPNPTPDVIRRYRELGGEKITFGADAHKPEHIAFHFADAAAIAQEAGFRYYVRFKEKKPEYLPIQ